MTPGLLFNQKAYLAMKETVYQTFRYYLNERESIRQRREAGLPGPWTQDPILANYKFTNVLRSNDRTTKWAVENWYGPNRDAPLEIQALNCGIFRYFGSVEFGEAVGFQRKWDPDLLMRTASQRLACGQKVFTGAYIITNGGRREPKQNVVVNEYLTPLRFNADKIVRIAEGGSWQQVCEFLQTLPGMAAFMSKEIALDMLLTPVLEHATDKLTWSPVGPGAVRGLNRLHGRSTDANLKQAAGLEEMKELLARLAAEPIVEGGVFATLNGPVQLETPGLIQSFPRIGVDYGVTDVQFSLCELDKYLRVKNGEGRPRSGYDYKKARAL